MVLSAAWAQLEAKLDLLRQHFVDFAASKHTIMTAGVFSLLDECLLEGLLSHTWQAWCGFCRSCVVGSCVGTVTSGGTTVAALPSAATEEHVSAAAIRAKNRGRPPYWGSTNTILRYEPTWGDVNVLVDILTRLQPANHRQLLAAFSSGSASARALQVIRNASAHHNYQSVTEIQALQSSYVVFPIGHPTHAMFWIEPHSSDFLVIHAMQELKLVASTAIL